MQENKKFMRFLIIDTSGPDSFVSLCDEIATQTKHLPSLKQSQTLIPTIQTLLNDQPIDFIGIGIGPGSFTGTRVGVMSAKTLGFALDIPLISFCSLKIYTPTEEGSFTLFSDAQSSGTFALKGERTSSGISFDLPYLKKEKCLPSRQLNLPFLQKYLLEKFLQSKGCSHSEISICYLKNL